MNEPEGITVTFKTSQSKERYYEFLRELKRRDNQKYIDLLNSDEEFAHRSKEAFAAPLPAHGPHQRGFAPQIHSGYWTNKELGTVEFSASCPKSEECGTSGDGCAFIFVAGVWLLNP